MDKILFAILVLTSQAYSQNKFEVIRGNISFTSNAPLELINATSEKTIGVIDGNTRMFAFIVNTGSFKGFNSELQRQHFNEKYMETDKYYQSTFSGTIQDSVNLHVNGIYKVHARGTLIIHGVKQPRTIPVTLSVSNGEINIQSEFRIQLADHGIAIPKIVDQKLATEILVKLKFVLAEKKTGRK